MYHCWFRFSQTFCRLTACDWLVSSGPYTLRPVIGRSHLVPPPDDLWLVPSSPSTWRLVIGQSHLIPPPSDGRWLVSPMWVLLLTACDWSVLSSPMSPITFVISFVGPGGIGYGSITWEESQTRMKLTLKREAERQEAESRVRAAHSMNDQ